MKIAILGAGVAGITTAYFLKQNGHDVSVIDRQSKAGSETSFANGGQLSYSHADPWAHPGMIGRIASWILFSKDAPLALRTPIDGDFCRWAWRYITSCNRTSAEQSTKALIKLGLHSKSVLKKLLKAEKLPFHHHEQGILHVFRNKRYFAYAKQQSELQNTLAKCPYEILDADACLEKEPLLSPKSLKGGIFYPTDATGDVHYFTKHLAKCCETLGVQFFYDQHIENIHHDNNSITAITTNKMDIEADIYVIALGSYSAALLQPLGIDLPIYPMKGYSISFNVKNHEDHHLSLGITDDGQKLFCSQLGTTLRVAGTVEFAKHDTTIFPKRISSILRRTQQLFPDLPIDGTLCHQWACLRSATPDSVPLLGKTPVDNLYLNTGHGSLGWTQAAGAAQFVSDLIDGNKTKIAAKDYAMQRFFL